MQPFFAATLALLASASTIAARSGCDELRMLCKVNSIRADHGLPALGLHPALIKAAQRHSDDQAKRRHMGHDGYDGSDPAERIEKAGYDWNSVAENVAYGYEQDECLDQWMQSPGHRENILKEDVTHMGIAVSYDGDTPYWTQDFAGDGRRHNYPSCPSGYDGYEDGGDYSGSDNYDNDYKGYDNGNSGYGDDYGNSGYGDDYGNSGYGNDYGNSGYGNDYGNSGYGNDYGNSGYGNDYGNSGYGNDYGKSGYGNRRPMSRIYGGRRGRHGRDYGRKYGSNNGRDYGHSGYGDRRGRSRSGRRHGGYGDRSCDDDERDGRRHGRRYGGDRPRHGDRAYLVRRQAEEGAEHTHGISHWASPLDRRADSGEALA